MGLCFAPVILLGYALTVQTSWHHTEKNVDGGLLQFQTCETGVGLDVKATTSGLFGMGIQYGFQWKDGNKSVAFQPKVGVSHTSESMAELPMKTQFELGSGLLFGYKDMRVGVEYWHMSNAGLKKPNEGVDMLLVQTGWVF